jgi:hypothetical protein
MYQDLFQKDEYKGEFSVGLEKSNKLVIQTGSTNATPAPGDLNADRLTVGSVGTTLINRGAGNYTSIKPVFSQGLNLLGARRLNEFSSRQAQNTFSKFVYTASFKQALVKNYQASVKFNAQLASEKLTPQQQMYLGGIDSVRGYPSGDYLADNGFYTNWELLIPTPFVPDWFKVPYGERPIKDEITGVLFFDFGYGSKRGRIGGEQPIDRMASIGAGVRVRLLNQALLRLEWGVPLDPLVNRPITESGGNRPRLHFSVDFQDDWPEEVERFTRVYNDEYLNKSAWRIVNDQMKDPNSPLRKKIYENLALAGKAGEMGYPKEAKRYYSKVVALGNAAYRQVDAYLKENYKHVKELWAMKAEAKLLYNEGDYEKARSMLEKVKEDAKMSPLVIEFAK